MADSTAKRYQPFVPVNTDMKEFTLKALLIGLILSVVLGAANAYLGLKAGMTIAATYPAAVIGMALLRIFKGSILEENFARTVGSIGSRRRNFYITCILHRRHLARVCNNRTLSSIDSDNDFGRCARNNVRCTS
jgi:hypothetical protein